MAKIAVRSQFVNLVGIVYALVFGEELGGEVKSFLKNLSYVAVGVVIATLLTLAFNILAGRILGPGKYGQFTVIQSVAMLLGMPMLLGFNVAMVRYSAERADFPRQSNIITTTYILVFLFAITLAVLYFAFSSQLSTVFSVPHASFYLVIIFAALFALFTLATNTLRALDKMRTLAIFQIVFATIALSAFLLFILGNVLSFKSAVYAMSIAYGTTSLVLILIYVRKYLKFYLDRAWASTLTTYSIFAVFGSLGFIIYASINPILINTYMTASDVGIYRAYHMASINVIALLFSIFNTVFSPPPQNMKTRG